MHPELSAHERHRRVVIPRPRARGTHPIAVDERGKGCDARRQLAIPGGSLEGGPGHLSEHAHRIRTHSIPSLGIKRAEARGAVGRPRPPVVVSDPSERHQGLGQAFGELSRRGFDVVVARNDHAVASCIGGPPIHGLGLGSMMRGPRAIRYTNTPR